MIAYTMVGTRNLEKALTFYKPLFEVMNLELCWRDESCFSYGKTQDLSFPRFIVGYPFDGNAQSIGNGVMTAFQFEKPETVDRLFEVALSSGGRSEGEPGYRPHYAKGFYAAYVRDPDGNKLAFIVYPNK